MVSSKFLSAAALAVVALGSTSTSTVSATAQLRQVAELSFVDDSSCVYDWDQFTCTPADSCSLQYRFGDVTPSQACRVSKTSDASKIPQQLHLAYAGTPAGSGMTVSWTTFVKMDDPTVWIGDAQTTLAVASKVSIETKMYYSDKKYSLYTYHATLSGLSAKTKYFYKVGSASSATFQSDVASFMTAPTVGSKDTFEIAVYGDFGVDANAVATTKYVNALPGTIDFVYHVGDVSYADNSFLSVKEVTGFYYEETYNRWMNSLTPAMMEVPYMVLVGNHEAECHSPSCILSSSKKDQLGNYTAFNARFKMPSAESGGVKNMWYSFDYASVHFTTISSETDYTGAPANAYTGRKNGNFGNQLAWLEADLKAADANRANVPWLIVGMHRAIYTLRSNTDGVPNDEALPVQKAFEELFIKYNVDLVVAGHVHSYERHLPIARSKAVMDGVSSDMSTYTNPKAPVYAISGAAGSTEGHNTYKNPSAPWNAKYDETHYGISHLKVTPSSLSWKFVSSDTSEVLDTFVINKA
ncbi:Calcineurin-like phosphoesterase [Globisporangium polare]